MIVFPSRMARMTRDYEYEVWCAAKEAPKESGEF